MESGGLEGGSRTAGGMAQSHRGRLALLLIKFEFLLTLSGTEELLTNV